MKSRRNRDFSRQTNSQKTYSGAQELFDTEEGLARYNHDIVEKLASGLGIKKGRDLPRQIIDFGAGTGALAELWRSKFGLTPICVEIDPDLTRILKNKGFKTYDDVDKLPSEILYLYTSNVLEHIQDDVKALQIIRRKMARGGKLAIYVPALPILFSDLDRNVGHFRRYRRKEIILKVKEAGYEVRECYYNDSLGLLASLALRFLGYKNRIGLGSKKSFLFYDKFIYPVSKLLDKMFFKRFIGKNLFLFAVNPYD
jgi:SAM-dependent methyltransferase